MCQKTKKGKRWENVFPEVSSRIALLNQRRSKNAGK
jgi:hypothetical protein